MSRGFERKRKGEMLISLLSEIFIQPTSIKVWAGLKIVIGTAIDFMKAKAEPKKESLGYLR